MLMSWSQTKLIWTITLTSGNLIVSIDNNLILIAVLSDQYCINYKINITDQAIRLDIVNIQE